MNRELIKHIKKILPLSENDLDNFLSKFKTVHLKKGEYFIKKIGS